MDIELHLCALEPQMLPTWARYFSGAANVSLHTLRDSHGGELPVGTAEVVRTDHRDIPFLISAPTMRVPGDISDTVNVYLAFRAALLAAQRSKVIRSVLSPPLGTGVGGMPFERAARQMHAAYSEVVLGEIEWRSTARGVLRHHAHLLS